MQVEPLGHSLDDKLAKYVARPAHPPKLVLSQCTFVPRRTFQRAARACLLNPDDDDLSRASPGDDDPNLRVLCRWRPRNMGNGGQLAAGDDRPMPDVAKYDELLPSRRETTA